MKHQKELLGISGRQKVPLKSLHCAATVRSVPSLLLPLCALCCHCALCALCALSVLCAATALCDVTALCAQSLIS